MSHRVITASEPILRSQCLLGEGPVWDPKRGLLYFVDIQKGVIHTYNPSTEVHLKAHYEGLIGNIVLRKNHPGFVCAIGSSLFFADPASEPGKLVPFVTPVKEDDSSREFIRFNDGYADRQGRYITGTMDLKGSTPRGVLYSIEPDGSIQQLLDGVTCSNGTGWTADDKTMYYIDSGLGKIQAYHYDLSTGSVTNPRTFTTNTFGDDGVFDGMCMDAEDCLWVCRWRSNRLVKYTPDGKIDLEIKFPKAANVTCCVFGGPNMDELYVTTASCAASGEDHLIDQFSEGGDLYRIKIDGTKGLEKYKFAG
ncbi:Ca2-binding protein Regucalcin/SMP30 [Phaffia rhodozyma]|uniref:Ca2-binding protein Regucalcin/SMP30 n=1 Tax=Phaffia rhodozyma TaxID=264483 RepID=A0A0F7SUW0_PHARH|nr:Ca2-binding protein Regucalcin/SMP30 [Phaffia rhodozyma]